MQKKISVPSESLAFRAAYDFIKEQKKPVLVVTNDDDQSRRLSNELLFMSSSIKQDDVLIFPDIDVLPYDDQEPSLVIQGLRALSINQALTSNSFRCLIVSISSLIRLIPGVDFWKDSQVEVASGASKEEVIKMLKGYGYVENDHVLERGGFVNRGRTLDVLTAAESTPYRIRFKGDKAVSFYSLDPLTLLISEKVDSFKVQRTHSFTFNEETIKSFRAGYRQLDGADISDFIYKEVSQGNLVSSVYNYTPLFEKEMNCISDLMPDQYKTIALPGISATENHYREYINKRYQDALSISGIAPLPPERLWMSSSMVAQFLNDGVDVHIRHEIDADYEGMLPHDIKEKLSANHAVKLLRDAANTYQKVLMVFNSQDRVVEIGKIMRAIKVDWQEVSSYKEFESELVGFYYLTDKHIGTGYYKGDEMAVFSEDELFGTSYKYEASESLPQDQLDFSLLEEGDPVTHILHGVGRYKGLRSLELNGELQDFVVIEYAEKSQCFVALDDLGLVLPYNGLSKDKAPLDKYGSKNWEKRLAQTFTDIRKTVTDLKSLARRKVQAEGIVFKGPDFNYQRFVSAFPYRETPDQASAISDVINDMCSNKHMDRLVCGDVGFGKTEVAMRAAFIAVNTGLQAVVMAPTTILSNQHYKSFKERFEPFGIKVVLLNKSLTPAQEAKALKEIESGAASIIISTSKVLKSVRFFDLGLMIVDEEHRFGVNQKELLYKLRTKIDLLSLSATPIPRSLSLSMKDIRDFSLISTPPAKRLSIKTFVLKYDERILRDAFEREKIRGGQLFYVYNDLEKINEVKEKIQRVIPEASIVIAHGKMPEVELEDNMNRFIAGKADILLASTIIETGIDIPNANTIFIDTSERLGLSQMHQLRGRVGRSDKQAYCFIIRPEKISEDAELRYKAILDSSSVGQGFRLARYDLEIRGAGELLGDVQKGNISKVGFSLFNKLFVDCLKSSHASIEETLYETQIASQELVSLPNEAFQSKKSLVSYYSKYAHAATPQEVAEITKEIMDYYAITRDEIAWIDTFYKLKTGLSAFGCRLIEIDDNEVHFMFNKASPLECDKFKIWLDSKDIDYVDYGTEVTLEGEYRVITESVAKALSF